MKRSDGVSVCSTLRAGGCTVPILAMTGNVSRSVLQFLKFKLFSGLSFEMLQ
jgi:hypothetical protein